MAVPPRTIRPPSSPDDPHPGEFAYDTTIDRLVVVRNNGTWVALLTADDI